MKANKIILSIVLSLSAFAQTTYHGISQNWYQIPKAAATITGTVSQTNYLKGNVANSMVVKSNGTVIIFYRSNGQNKWVQSNNGGNTWSSPGSLPSPAVNGLSAISADIDTNDNIYILWKSGSFSLGFSKFNGTSWSSIYSINAQSQTISDSITFSQITVDRKGRIHLMWQQGNNQNSSPGVKSTCWYARSTNGGNSFSSSILLSQGNNHHAAFPVSDFGGTSKDTLMIAWRENINGGTHPNNWNWDVKARITYDGGATWNPVFTLEGSSNPTDDDQWDPNIVVDKNGFIHAFFHIYHNATFPDYNAKIMYKYSLNGGNTWSTPTQLSTSNIRSHLIKTAYDYTNNLVWCVWKDEMDFGNIPNNPQSDLKAVYINNPGTPLISTQEFLCDHLSNEVALHNFKVGNDGTMRATYNISKIEGLGDTLFYTQRNPIITSVLSENIITNQDFNIFPNPTNAFFNLSSSKPISKSLTIKIYNSIGALVSEFNEWHNTINLPTTGRYFVEIIHAGIRQVIKVIKH